ncbi:unnamed protein product, partial [Brenthis ino]
MVAACCGHIGGHVPVLYQDISPQVYCGRALARSLALLCYEGPMNEKRSEIGTMYNALLPPYYKESDEDISNESGWWVPLHKARSMSLPSRNKRLVVSECCDKPCKISELMAYC